MTEKERRVKINKQALARKAKWRAEDNRTLYYRTVYQSQKTNSRHRGHDEPTYTRQELQDWIIAQPHFETLYQDYIASDYNKWKCPSVDRIDNTKGYSMDNIELMTWKQNSEKSDL